MTPVIGLFGIPHNGVTTHRLRITEFKECSNEMTPNNILLYPKSNVPFSYHQRKLLLQEKQVNPETLLMFYREYEIWNT